MGVTVLYLPPLFLYFLLYRKNNTRNEFIELKKTYNLRGKTFGQSIYEKLNSMISYTHDKTVFPRLFRHVIYFYQAF